MKVTALYIGKSISLKGFAQKHSDAVSSRNPLVWAQNEGYVVLLSYGVAVFWNQTKAEQKKSIQKILPFVDTPSDEPYEENIEVEENAVSNVIENNQIQITKIKPDIVSVVSLVLSRSVVLEVHEISMNVLTDMIGNAISYLHQRQHQHMTARKLMNTASNAMYVHNTISNSVSMLDTPNMVWDDAALYDFYKKLLLEYEIGYRYKLLRYRLQTTLEHSKFILQYLESRKSFWLEITIIALIALEIVIFVYDISIR